MRVLCKKTYICNQYVIYQESKYYDVNIKHHTYDDNNNIDSFFVEINNKYGNRFIFNNCIDSRSISHYPIFSDYFYTEYEVRKIKLKKLSAIN